jgi:hypothetical protein
VGLTANAFAGNRINGDTSFSRIATDTQPCVTS